MSFSIRFGHTHTHTLPFCHCGQTAREMHWLIKIDRNPLTKMTIDFRSFYQNRESIPPWAAYAAVATEWPRSISAICLCVCVYALHQYASKIESENELAPMRNEKATQNSMPMADEPLMGGNFRFCIFLAAIDEMSSILGMRTISRSHNGPTPLPFIFVIGLDWFQFLWLCERWARG